MPFLNDDREALKRVNNVEIPVDLFLDAVRTLEDLGENANILEYRVPALCTLFRGKGYAGRQSIQLTEAVESRMQALLRLKDEPDVREWDTPSGRMGDDGYDPYLVAAAKESLIEHGWNEVAFDREGFRARMLSMKD